MNGTAFTRPQPSVPREHCSIPLSDEACRTNFGHAPLPLSPLKHYSSINGGSFDRPTYLPQYGINSYTDLMSASNSFSTPRGVQSYSDAHVQSFQSIPFSSSVPQTGSYWSDSRGHPSLHDPYTPYSYNKFHSTYDSYNKGSLLRSTPYQDAINRSAFDSSRPYYRSHDNFQGTCFVLAVNFSCQCLMTNN